MTALRSRGDCLFMAGGCPMQIANRVVRAYTRALGSTRP